MSGGDPTLVSLCPVSEGRTLSCFHTACSGSSSPDESLWEVGRINLDPSDLLCRYLEKAVIEIQSTWNCLERGPSLCYLSINKVKLDPVSQITTCTHSQADCWKLFKQHWSYCPSPYPTTLEKSPTLISFSKAIPLGYQLFSFVIVLPQQCITLKCTQKCRLGFFWFQYSRWLSYWKPFNLQGYLTPLFS